jgi:protein-S-isoprenylcysteine O-methyltransferase Ste14
MLRKQASWQNIAGQSTLYHSSLTTMKLKHPINLHKGLTAPVILGMMAAYGNFGLAPWVYLALHGTYGLMWLVKDAVYPDQQWENEASLGTVIGTFFSLGAYWLPPFLLISSGSEPPAAVMALAIATNIFGVLLHFGSDAQKYFTLKYRSGLITEGFFARCRNPNYLGEILIYLGFAILAQQWLPFLVLGTFFAAIFLPNMLKKDRSLSRYPEFAAYKNNSGLLIPKLFGHSSAVVDEPAS